MTETILAICFDFGDTLADEATEVKDDSQTTLRADLIPGAAELLHELNGRGYRLALIADGRPGTYVNVLGHYDLYRLFEAIAVSEEVGVAKPHPRMFHYAMEQLGIKPIDYGRTIMVGNFLERDIKGANSLGMISVWIDWSPRRPKEPAEELEEPNFTIKEPLELLPIIDQLEGK